LSNFCKAVGFWKPDTLLIMNVEQVFSADMFETKFQGNVLSKSAGREYREKVLAPGACKDAAVILRDFLGREPTEEAFLRSKGLL
jgi:thimet oligopeptidase